jgi:hypothetical protein
MIRYTVVWIRDAENELADLWIRAPDRNSVAAAARDIDTELAQNAAFKGVEIAEGLRAFTSAPLRVLFTVDDGDRIVKVLRVVRH